MVNLSVKASDYVGTSEWNDGSTPKNNFFARGNELVDMKKPYAPVTYEGLLAGGTHVKVPAFRTILSMEFKRAACHHGYGEWKANDSKEELERLKKYPGVHVTNLDDQKENDRRYN